MAIERTSWISTMLGSWYCASSGLTDTSSGYTPVKVPKMAGKTHPTVASMACRSRRGALNLQTAAPHHNPRPSPPKLSRGLRGAHGHTRFPLRPNPHSTRANERGARLSREGYSARLPSMHELRLAHVVEVAA